MKKSKHFSLGEKVFAKVKGYPAWPARIDEELGKKFRVYFYGTGETGVVKAEDLFSYIDHKEQFTKPLKRKDYNDALEEIEAALKEEGASEHSIPNDKEIEETEENKRGIKRKLSNDSLATEEPKPKKITPVKKENEKKLQTSQTAAKKDISTPLSETKANSKKEESPSVDEGDSDGETKKNNNKEPSKISDKKPAKPKKISETEDELMDVDMDKNDSLEEDNFKFVLVTAEQLRKTIVDCSKIMMDMDDKEEIDSIPEDLISLASNAILLARLEYDKFIGIKINKDRPTHFKNGAERLQWSVDNAQRALELKDKVELDTINPEDEPDLFEFDLELSKEQIDKEKSSRLMERKKSKLLWLKIESRLVELDAHIKTSLGLDKADPKKALKHLDSMLDLKIDPLMLKKHPHVVDMVKRLRRYIGNVKEWKLKEKELTDFKKQAEEIRVKAETVYSKFQSLFTVPENTSFGEVFQDQVINFKMQTKHMAENQVFALCAEPDSKQAQWDEMDEEESKLIPAKFKDQITKEHSEKENISDNEKEDTQSGEEEITDNHG